MKTRVVLITDNVKWDFHSLNKSARSVNKK